MAICTRKMIIALLNSMYFVAIACLHQLSNCVTLRNHVYEQPVAGNDGTYSFSLNFTTYHGMLHAHVVQY